MRIVVLVFAVALASGCGGSKVDAPPYKITANHKRGYQHNVDVTVTSTKGLSKVFDAVAASFKDEGGYLVSINCATGGTRFADNRLANGEVAVGRMGAAATGIPAGKQEYEPVSGAHCP